LKYLIVFSLRFDCLGILIALINEDGIEQNYSQVGKRDFQCPNIIVENAC